MRKFLACLLLLLLVPVAFVYGVSRLHTDMKDLPELHSGDLIFETTLVRDMTLPIMFATGSVYTHVGVIHKQADGYTVIQAMNVVAETPLADFLHSGWGERITIERYPGLTQAQGEAIVKNAESYLGRPYNHVFYMKSNAMYCSEIPYFAYRSANLSIGTLQKIGELYVNNPAVHRLFKQRWRMHPACQAVDTTYDACWAAVLEEPIITPVSLAHDPKLAQVYSNYPF